MVILFKIVIVIIIIIIIIIITQVIIEVLGLWLIGDCVICCLNNLVLGDYSDRCWFRTRVSTNCKITEYKLILKTSDKRFLCWR